MIPPKHLEHPQYPLRLSSVMIEPFSLVIVPPTRIMIVPFNLTVESSWSVSISLPKSIFTSFLSNPIGTISLIFQTSLRVLIGSLIYTYLYNLNWISEFGQNFEFGLVLICNQSNFQQLVRFSSKLTKTTKLRNLIGWYNPFCNFTLFIEIFTSDNNLTYWWSTIRYKNLKHHKVINQRKVCNPR